MSRRPKTRSKPRSFSFKSSSIMPRMRYTVDAQGVTQHNRFRADQRIAYSDLERVEFATFESGASYANSFTIRSLALTAHSARAGGRMRLSTSSSTDTQAEFERAAAPILRAVHACRPKMKVDVSESAGFRTVLMALGVAMVVGAGALAAVSLGPDFTSEQRLVWNLFLTPSVLLGGGLLIWMARRAPILRPVGEAMHYPRG